MEKTQGTLELGQFSVHYERAESLSFLLQNCQANQPLKIMFCWCSLFHGLANEVRNLD